MGTLFCVTKWGLVDFTVNHVISVQYMWQVEFINIKYNVDCP